MTNNYKKKLFVFGCKNTTLEFIKRIIDNNFVIDGCITISKEKALEQKVAGYFDLNKFCKNNKIPLYTVKKYNLSSAYDKELINSLEIDIIFCIGWQRLIPDWLLSKLSVGAFGMHGSNKPLPHGRGRSPLNWSLIQGKNIFYTHLFQYLPGIDDGPIVGVQKFDINQWDNCNTLHLKNTLAMTKLALKHLPKMLKGTVETYPQPLINPSYFPKRSAEDGIIFWSDSVIDIYNLIRAVTKPFHGAFSFINDDETKKIVIWEAIPFDTRLDWEDKSFGEIIEIFNDNSFIVKAGDGSMLIKNYEFANNSAIATGMKLGNSSFNPKNWILPR
tara:strand:+ start:86 stop:1075 length:990 start_codon:yes stop_codon:yes gene_type:complete